MAGQLLLINPRKRRAGTKRRSAAQKAATARLVAFNRAKRGGHAKRRTSAKRRTVRHYATNPAIRKARRRSYKRNPSARRRSSGAAGGVSMGFTSAKLMGAVKSAGIAAGGALAVDYAYGFIKSYLPESMQSPVDSAGAMNPLYYLAKGLAAVAIGVFGGKVVSPRIAAKMAEGSLVVTAYTALRNVLPATISAGLGYYQPAATDTPNLPGRVNQPGRTVNGSITDMRAYMRGASRGGKARTAYDNPGMQAYV